MAKQRIRLTESQLHNIIRKCVNEAVNELDPRTYASYADKRAEQGQMDKATKGRQAAANAWNKQYGRNGKYRMAPFGNGYQIQGRDTNIGVMGNGYRKNMEFLNNGWDTWSDGDETARERLVPGDLGQGYEKARQMVGKRSRIDRSNADTDDNFAEYNN